MKHHKNEIDIHALAEILDQFPLSVAYLFGSFARKTQGPRSDLDIAVLFDAGIPLPDHQALEADIASVLAQKLALPRIDIINLSKIKNPVLKKTIVTTGIPILVKDILARQHLEVHVRHEYEDTKYLRRRSYASMIHQIKQGTFGKAPLSPKEEEVFQSHVHR
jgi:uncharacterized protein